MQLIQGLSLEATRWFQACSFLKLLFFWMFLHVNDPYQCYEKWKESCVKSSQQMPSVPFFPVLKDKIPIHTCTTPPLSYFIHSSYLPSPSALTPFLGSQKRKCLTSSWTLTPIPPCNCPRPCSMSPSVPDPVSISSPSLWAPFSQLTNLPILKKQDKRENEQSLPSLQPHISSPFHKNLEKVVSTPSPLLYLPSSQVTAIWFPAPSHH